MTKREAIVELRKIWKLPKGDTYDSRLYFDKNVWIYMPKHDCYWQDWIVIKRGDKNHEFIPNLLERVVEIIDDVKRW